MHSQDIHGTLVNLIVGAPRLSRAVVGVVSPSVELTILEDARGQRRCAASNGRAVTRVAVAVVAVVFLVIIPCPCALRLWLQLWFLDVIIMHTPRVS